MWDIYLEIGLALALAAFIVWWTWPKKKRPGEESRDESEERRPPER